jgi:hypothetical protein
MLDMAQSTAREVLHLVEKIVLVMLVVRNVSIATMTRRMKHRVGCLSSASQVPSYLCQNCQFDPDVASLAHSTQQLHVFILFCMSKTCYAILSKFMSDSATCSSINKIFLRARDYFASLLDA